MIYGYMRETWEFGLRVQKTETPNISLKYDLSQRKQHVFGNILQKPWRKLIKYCKNCGGFKKMFECKFFVHSETLHLQ